MKAFQSIVSLSHCTYNRTCLGIELACNRLTVRHWGVAKFNGV